MARTGVTLGARAPLFDRLAGREAVPNGDPPRPMRVLDRSELAESLQRELQRLLNTRRPQFKSAALAGLEPTVIEYGLHDYSAMYTQNPEDRKRLASLIKSTIERFEPRLHDLTVEVTVLGTSEKALLVKVDGSVQIGRETERMSFAVNVSEGTAGENAVG